MSNKYDGIGIHLNSNKDTSQLEDISDIVNETLVLNLTTLDMENAEHSLLLGGDVNYVKNGVPTVLLFYITLLREHRIVSAKSPDILDSLSLICNGVDYDKKMEGTLYLQFVYDTSSHSITFLKLTLTNPTTLSNPSDATAHIHTIYADWTIRHVMKEIYTSIDSVCSDLFNNNKILNDCLTYMGSFTTRDVEDIAYVSRATDESTDDYYEEGMCKICLNNRKDTVLIPCGHYVCCKDCAYLQTKCPVCVQPVSSMYKVFE